MAESAANRSDHQILRGQMVGHQPGGSRGADEHGNHKDRSHRLKRRYRGQRRRNHQPKAQGAGGNAQRLREAFVECGDFQPAPEQGHQRRDHRAGQRHAGQFGGQGGQGGGVGQGLPARGAQPDQLFKIAHQRVFYIQMHLRAAGLFQQQHARREHGGEHHAHRRARLDPAIAADGFDQHHSDNRRPGGPQPHRPGCNATADQKPHHNAGQHHMADRIPDQGLSAQDQEIAGQRASHGGQRADQHGCQRELHKFGTHHAFLIRRRSRAWRKARHSSPRAGASSIETAKPAAKTSTMTGPVGKSGAVAEIAAPI